MEKYLQVFPEDDRMRQMLAIAGNDSPRLLLRTLESENSLRHSAGRAAEAACENRRQKGHSVIAVLRIVLWAGLLTVAGSCVAQVKAAPDPSRQQALTLEQQGKNVDAESAWRVYLKAHPTSPNPMRTWAFWKPSGAL